MKLTYSLVTYNAMGGHPALSFIGDFLLRDAPRSLGSSIDTIDIYAHLRHLGPRSANLPTLTSRFDERLTTLPLLWFKRKKRLVEIAYASQVGFAEELLEQAEPVSGPEVFGGACRETLSLIPLISPRLRAKDHFDIDTLRRHL